MYQSINHSVRVVLHVPCRQFDREQGDELKAKVKDRWDYCDFDCDGDNYNIVLECEEDEMVKKEEIERLVNVILGN